MLLTVVFYFTAVTISLSSIDLYEMKKRKKKLLTPILEIFQEAFLKGSLPTSMKSALIVLLPKQVNPLTSVRICEPYSCQIPILR